MVNLVWREEQEGENDINTVLIYSIFKKIFLKSKSILPREWNTRYCRDIFKRHIHEGFLSKIDKEPMGIYCKIK